MLSAQRLGPVGSTRMIPLSFMRYFKRWHQWPRCLCWFLHGFAFVIPLHLPSLPPPHTLAPLILPLFLLNLLPCSRLVFRGSGLHLPPLKILRLQVRCCPCQTTVGVVKWITSGTSSNSHLHLATNSHNINNSYLLEVILLLEGASVLGSTEAATATLVVLGVMFEREVQRCPEGTD